ncbi:amidophosphoribosyltransferase [Spirochaeta africana]|uniref:Amidophosphoribosyltransferase n=1 Tax=Spirochaeta africana (strain ATCC 700263 / DSM 8902 / Z-7692) TaxID=889378 RepID=H9UKG1_SPIAZ|nr:amidophosphoribosyltransferase [Spirochaeta africana]AFG38004.1 amidophosphoribosyltransferase [Spirochaeta africana DSM 8902]
MDGTSESPKHYCGVVGLYAKTPVNIPEKLFFPLFSLQHRGQESAGVAYRKDGETVVYKDIGMVSQVLSRYLDKDRPSKLGIGHVRYSTLGGNKIENVQPIHVACNKGEIALAHNGNLSNSSSIKNNLFQGGSIFQTTSDSELFVHLISRSVQPSFHLALIDALSQMQGAFSMVMMHDDSLYAVRDPYGFRPLYIGTRDDLTVIASETCALDIMKVSDRREVKPGELIRIDDTGITSEIYAPVPEPQRCIFELIYFARPDSQVFGQSVHLRRKQMGAALAIDDPVEADLVVPVPDSGNSAALGYSEQAGVPLDYGLTRNHYAGRSFIMPTTSERELAVRMKLHPVREVIEGKRIILVDDSLVRGTTARILVRLLREAGAAEIHLRLCSPEIRWPCFFGIDIPTRNELISNHRTPEMIAEFIGADTVQFLKLSRLLECVDEPSGYCTSCFSGKYRLAVTIPESEQNLPRDNEPAT